MATPKFSELYQSVLADLQNVFGISSIFSKTFLPALATVQAGKLKLIYLSKEKVQQNVFPDLADNDTLLRYGKIRLNRSINPAGIGEYTCLVTGVNGGIIPANTTFQSMDDSTSPGKLFVCDDIYTLNGTSGSIAIRSFEGGSDSALEVGDRLQVTAPLPYVDSYITVSAILVTPTDAETFEEYRSKILESYILEPQGGARSDYRTWTQDVEGIRTVYPYAKNGEAGVVDLYIEATVPDSSDGHGTPTAQLLLDVQSEIEPNKFPLGVFKINYLEVTPIAVDIDIVNLSDVSLLSIIQSNLETELYKIRPYIAGADSIQDQKKGYLYSSTIFSVVVDSIGTATFDDITMTVDGNVVNIYQFINGNIPYINSVTNS